VVFLLVRRDSVPLLSAGPLKDVITPFVVLEFRRA
jgi:hypothetical protein